MEWDYYTVVNVGNGEKQENQKEQQSDENVN